MNGMRQKAEEAHKAAVAKFSPEAKVADQKIIEITSSSSLTAQQKHQQLDTLMNSLSPAVKDEIMKAMQGPQ
jgi:hypothetical protein